MRWGDRPAIPFDSLRYKRRFLLWPLRIAGQTRWLEFATWEERYRQKPLATKAGVIKWLGWWPEKWVTP